MKKMFIILLVALISATNLFAQDDNAFVANWQFPIDGWFAGAIAPAEGIDAYPRSQAKAYQVSNFDAANADFDAAWASAGTASSIGGAAGNRLGVAASDNGPADFTGSFKTLYDDNNMYILVQWTDDDVTGTESVELYLSPYFKLNATDRVDFPTAYYTRWSQFGANKLLFKKTGFDAAMMVNFSDAGLGSINWQGTTPTLTNNLFVDDKTAPASKTVKWIITIGYPVLTGSQRPDFNKIIWAGLNDGKGISFDLKVNDNDADDALNAEATPVAKPAEYYFSSTNNDVWQSNIFAGFLACQTNRIDITTNPASSTTSSASTLNGNITSIGDKPVTAYGFCWNTTGNPTIADSKIDKGSATSTGDFTHNLTGLTAFTKYYVKAYISNGVDIAYGSEVNFTTTGPFELTTNAATSILAKTATLNGNINILEASNITTYGFCWNTTGTPTVSDNKSELGTNPNSGVFAKSISGLNGSTTYYVRTYATLNGNTAYGNQQNFTTALPDDYDITVQISGSGTVSANSTTLSNGALVNVLRGATKTFTFSPAAGYQITGLKYNGIDVSSQVNNNQYTTPAVNAYGTLVVMFGNATKTINVTTAGTLTTLLTSIEKSIITNLTVTGNIDARDVKCMRDEMTVLADLNLKDASIVAYNGNGGTYFSPSSITYPVNEMPHYSFYNGFTNSSKISLRKIELPTSVTSIGNSAFQNCTNIKSIICLITTPPTITEWAETFKGISSACIVYVPVGKVATYKAASVWSSLNIVEPGVSTTTPTVNGLIYAPNAGPSEIKSFKVSGGLITDDIIVTAPTNFEISTKTGTEFVGTNSITLTQVDGMVADTTLYVRLKAGLAVNTFIENITLSSTGFTSLSIALNGAVRTTPETIHVATAGTLSSLLTSTEKAAITKLTVTGNIDARDVKCMRDEMTVLANLNLKDASIVAYSGTDGTYIGANPWDYIANELPLNSFCTNYGYNGKLTLRNVILPSSLVSISNNAFASCKNITKIILPINVASLGYQSLFLCLGLKTIICLNPTPPTLGGMSFSGGVNPTAVYVPVGSVPAYKAVSGWNLFEMAMPNQITNIVEYKLKTTTQAATRIKLTTAKLNGTVNMITDSPVTAHGFCWNTTGLPTISDSKVDNGATTTEGAYSNAITGLTGATTYYVRAFATDGISGTVYGDEVSFTTAEIPATSSLSGNFYNSQYWPLSKSPYTITGNVNLAVGTTLTIEPGVVVNFAGAYEIMTMGSIVANGTATDSITFNANGNICTFLDFKNAKLSDSELSYLKMIGHKIMPPLYAKALKTQGTCTDSLVLNNVRIETSEISCDKNVVIRNSKVSNLNGGTTYIQFDNCKLKQTEFGSYMNSLGDIKYNIKNSVAENILVFEGAYNSNAFISNSVIKSSNLGKTQLTVLNSKLINCNYSTLSYMPFVKIDSAFLINSSLNLNGGNCNVSNSIFKTDSTQTLNLNGTITKSQFIGNNNKLGGVGLDAVSGTITNSSIVNHRIGLQTGSLTINNSNLINNSQYAIKNSGATQIDAKSNFWGVGNTTTAAVKAKIWDYYKDMNLGKVLYDNYLTTPYVDCPITPPQNFRKVAATAGVNYSWNANPETDTKGYKLYYGKSDGFTFENVIDLGNVTSYNLPTAAMNDTVLVTAYDLQAEGVNDMLEGHESWYSEDVPLPAKAGVISGAATVCQGQNTVNYTVPAITNASSYVWALPTGVTGTSTTNSINVSFSKTAVSGDISVFGRNEYGDGANATKAITVNPLPVAAGTITGETTVCQGTNSVIYSVPAITNATAYAWTLPTGVTGTSTTNSITVNFGTTAVPGNVTVKGTNGCGDGVAATLAVTVNPLPIAAGTITGSATVCQGEVDKIYTVPTITNATSYIWTLPTGATGTSTTNSISVSFSNTAVSGNIAVKGHNDCGDGVTKSLAITVKPLLGTIGEISGTSTLCAGTTGVIYTIPALPFATNYVWTLPTGATGTSSTNSITVAYSNTAISGNITVKAVNDCGETAVKSLAITVKPLLGSIGTISGTSTLCASTKDVVYTIPAVANATSYVWTLPNGMTGTSTTRSIAVDFANNATSGEIAVKAVNDCGETETVKLAVTVNAKPATPVIVRTDYTLKSSSVEGNQWYDSKGALNNAVNQEYIVTANEEYYVIVTKNGCSSEPSNKIRVDNTALNELTLNSKIKIYPNPVHNELRLEYDGETHFEILNLVGQVLINGRLVKTALVETSDLFPGIYLIRFTDGKTSITERFIKK